MKSQFFTKQELNLKKKEAAVVRERERERERERAGEKHRGGGV